MIKCDEASPTIILAGQALLVKMLITLEPDAIFGSNFIHICILKLPSYWYEKKVTRLHQASFLAGRALLVKCSQLLNSMAYLVQILYIYVV